MKESTYRIIMMVGLYIGILLFILAIIALVKNVKEIKTDAIIYGMEKHNFAQCTCYQPDGHFTQIILDDYITTNKNKSG